MPKATVIVTTFNRLQHLKFTLSGLNRQTEPDFNVIIADDGSTPETKEYLESLKGRTPFEFQHIWHEHTEFRKSVILNKAIAKANSEHDIIIFCDGDCIVRKDYVAQHLESLKPGNYQVGRSVQLSAEYSEKIENFSLELEKLESISIAGYYPIIQENKCLMAAHVNIEKDKIGYLMSAINPNSLQGSNFSTYKRDLVKINGFNEEYIGYGYEDLDIGYRLQNIGIKPINLMQKALNFHFNHPVTIDNQEKYTANHLRAITVLTKGTKDCAIGLKQYIK